MYSAEEWACIHARRALLRQQIGLVGPRLSWLARPDLIPDDSIDASVDPEDMHLCCFSLAAWMLIEIVQAADMVYPALDWRTALEHHDLAPARKSSVMRAVLAPAARHAPGLFAMAEIVSAVPLVAARSGVLPSDWHQIALRSQSFAAALALDGTAIQMLIRSYLSAADPGADDLAVRTLDPALLRLDDHQGLTTVTPLNSLLKAARRSASVHLETYRTACVALQAPAPVRHGAPAGETMFGAIWSSFACAAQRLVFPRYRLALDPMPPEADADPDYETAFDHIAARHREVLAETASHHYPASVERILDNLLAAARRRPSLPAMGQD